MVELRNPIEGIKTNEDIEKLGAGFDLLTKLKSVKIDSPLPEIPLGESVPETESLIKSLPDEEIERLAKIADARKEKELQALQGKIDKSNAEVAATESAPVVNPPESSKPSADKQKRFFDPADIQDVILSMIKEHEFTKTYTIFGNIPVVFKMASDADIKFFNDEQYRKMTSSKKDLKKIYYQVPEIKEELLKSIGPTNPQLSAMITQILSMPVSEEVYVYVPPNTFRESALDELALHIVQIGSEKFDGLTNKEKADKLSTYSYKFIDYLFSSPLAHFRELIGEAINKFQVF
jgi:hypothetical protein